MAKEKTFLRYGEKGFNAFIIHIQFIQRNPSPLIFDQKKHDVHENSINTLSNHFCISISAAKINQFLKPTNSLEDFIDIFIQIERNNFAKTRKI